MYIYYVRISSLSFYIYYIIFIYKNQNLIACEILPGTHFCLTMVAPSRGVPTNSFSLYLYVYVILVRPTYTRPFLPLLFLPTYLPFPLFVLSLSSIRIYYMCSLSTYSSSLYIHIICTLSPFPLFACNTYTLYILIYVRVIRTFFCLLPFPFPYIYYIYVHYIRTLYMYI